MSSSPSPTCVEVGWLARPARYSAAKIQSPLRSPVNTRPVRLPPCAAGRQPDDGDPRVGRAQAGHRPAPVVPVAERRALDPRDLLPPGDQPRAGAAARHPRRRGRRGRAHAAPRRATTPAGVRVTGKPSGVERPCGLRPRASRRAMPSRMSCSLTTTSSTAELVHEHPQDQRAGADDVDPARVHHRHRGPALARGGEQVGGDRADGVDRDPGAVDGVGVVGRQLQRERGDRGHRAGQADQAWPPRRPAPRRRTSASAARMSASARADLLGRSAGRRAGAARSAARSRCRPSGPPARRRRRRGRTRSSRRRCRRPGTAAAAAARRAPAPRRPARRWRRGRTAPPPRAPVTTSGCWPEGGDAPCPRSRRGWRRPGWRWWPPCAPRSRRARGRRRRTRRAPAGCARSPPGASRPVASTPWPSRTISIRRSRSVCAPVGRDVGDQQADRVGAAVDRGDAASRAVLGGWAHGPGRPPLPHLLDRAVADRVDPGPGGQRVRGEGVQALDPVGHAAGASSGWAARRGRRGWPGRPRARPGSRPRARDRWPARPATRASGRPTPAGWRPPSPGGRSGSTASGTACRPPAAARSRRRRAARTGSGARRPTSARGGRPSCRPMIARSVVGDRARSPARGRRRRSVTDVQQALVPGHGRRPACRRRAAVPASPSTRLAVDDDHQPVAGQHVGEPLPGLPLGVGGVGLPLELLLQLRRPLVQLPALRGELRPAPPGRPGTGGSARRG